MTPSITAQVEKLRVDPGDLVVLWLEEPLSNADTERLSEHLKDLLPAGARPIILLGDVRIESLSDADLERLGLARIA